MQHWPIKLSPFINFDKYDVQDGFGWTNGVLLKLMNELGDIGTVTSGNCP